jgi:DUF2934 family protein
MKPRKPQAAPRSKRPTSKKGPSLAARDANAQALTLHERIAQRAYELYEERGRRAGYALEDWLRAEREIRSTVSEMPKQR